LEEQHSKSFKIWSAIIWINTESKSLVMKSSPDISRYMYSLSCCL